MMDVHRSLIRSSQMVKQSTDFLWSMVRLQRQIKDCYIELSLVSLGRIPHNKDRVRDLEDEIFGCKIEIQVLEVRVNQLATQTLASAQDIQAAWSTDTRTPYISWLANPF